MGTHKLAGFTIIETMLFLGISSALIVLLIAGTGNSLNVERYRDAAETFKSTLQQQYADLASVQNGRNNNWTCGSDATPTTTNINKDIRGQSPCMLLGKYVRVENEKISIYRVIGFQRADTTQDNDILSLKTNYLLNISRDEAEKTNLEWGTKIAYPATENGTPDPSRPPSPRKMGILVVRSPDSGQIYTFTNSDDDVPNDDSISPADLSSMLLTGAGVGASGQADRLICINSGGLQSMNDRGVAMNSFAAGASAIELQTNEYLAEIGSPYRC